MPISLDERPIFIIGSERSGTTLVLAILACHPRIAVPEVTWYYPRFRPYLHTYGDLTSVENFNVLAHEMANGLRVPFWRMTDANPATFGAEIAKRAAEIEQSTEETPNAIFGDSLGAWAVMNRLFDNTVPSGCCTTCRLRSTSIRPGAMTAPAILLTTAHVPNPPTRVSRPIKPMISGVRADHELSLIGHLP